MQRSGGLASYRTRRPLWPLRVGGANSPGGAFGLIARVSPLPAWPHHRIDGASFCDRGEIPA
jgi:hypothetical protein